MNMQAKSQKYGHLIAAGGMGVALMGFFLIPFVTMTMSNSNTQSPQFQQSQTQISSETFSALQAASIQGFIWLDALLAGSILLVALLLAFSRNPFDMNRVPLDKQVQWGTYALIGASVVSLLVQYIVMTTIPGSLIGMFSSLFSASSSASSAIQSILNSISISYSTGSWFYLFGMLIAIGGEIYALRAARPAAAVVPTQVSSPYMPPVQSTPSSWQQPSFPNQQDWQEPNQLPPQHPSLPAQEQYPPRQPWQPPQPPTNYQ